MKKCNIIVCGPAIGKTYLAMHDERFVDVDGMKADYKYNLYGLPIEEKEKGKLNKNTKLIPKILKNTFKKLTNVGINVDSKGFFHITNIPDEESFKVLCVFFCLKPINATINKVMNLQNPENTWMMQTLRSL